MSDSLEEMTGTPAKLVELPRAAFLNPTTGAYRYYRYGGFAIPGQVGRNWLGSLIRLPREPDGNIHRRFNPSVILYLARLLLDNDLESRCSYWGDDPITNPDYLVASYMEPRPPGEEKLPPEEVPQLEPNGDAEVLRVVLKEAGLGDLEFQTVVYVFDGIFYDCPPPLVPQGYFTAVV